MTNDAVARVSGSIPGRGQDENPAAAWQQTPRRVQIPERRPRQQRMVIVALLHQ
jgi:hypothetical protein